MMFFFGLINFSKILGDVLGETCFYISGHKTHTTEALVVNDMHYLVFDVEKMRAFAKSKNLEVELQVAAGSIARKRIQKKTFTVKGMRQESDSMGPVDIPKGSYYGIRTQRCLNVMSASGVPLSHYPSLVRALCQVKKACALANMELGKDVFRSVLCLLLLGYGCQRHCH